MSTFARDGLVAACFGVAVLACGAKQEALPKQAVPPRVGAAQQVTECRMDECPPATDPSGKPYTFIHPKTRTATELLEPPGLLAPCPDGHSMHGYTGRCLRNLDKTCSWEVIECRADGGSAR
jgi:hypothetical protein